MQKIIRLIRPLLEQRERVIMVLVIAIGVLLAFQLFYPSSRAPLFVRLNGVRLGGESKQAIEEHVRSEYNTVPVEVVVAGKLRTKTLKTTLNVTGIEPDAKTTANEVVAYPWWQRIVPFSMLAKALFSNSTVHTRSESSRLTSYAKTVSAACYVSPVSATIAIMNDVARIQSAKNGQICPRANIERQLKQLGIERDGMKTEIKADVAPPVRTDKAVEETLKQTQRLLDTKLRLTVADTPYQVSGTQIGKWLAFQDADKGKRLDVTVNETAMSTYLDGLQKEFYVAPGVTTITTVDGQETGRVTGGTGRGIDIAKTAQAIHAQLDKGDGTVTAMISVLPPKMVYQRSYTATQSGLQALLNDLARDKGDYGIAVRLADGTLVSANGTKRYHPASTYKMYVAYSLLKRIAGGQIKWEDSATLGKNISQCFDSMIINSDNTCAEWFGDKIGWSNINNEIHALGLGNTSTIRGGMYSTADDETLFLYKLYTDSALAQPEKDRLIDIMKRQVYRSGIPAGVGVPVADKVGFLDGKLHDSGIVYGSKTYILSVMTQGSSWAQIADTARQIQAQLNRM